MNCANHPEVAAAAFCRICGKPLCQACQQPAQGTIFCAEHVPAEAAAQSPYTAPVPPASSVPIVDTSVSPGLAFLLGLIPGVGAIYNGQYAKGLIHAVILGLLFSIVNSHETGMAGLEPLFGLLIMIWWVYMPFEAYHTARRRQLGHPVDEFSSLISVRGANSSPLAPILLIGFGVLFLLNNLDVIRFYHLLRYWPVFLIALGVYLLYARFSGPGEPITRAEVADERQ